MKSTTPKVYLDLIVILVAECTWNRYITVVHSAIKTIIIFSALAICVPPGGRMKTLYSSAMFWKLKQVPCCFTHSTEMVTGETGLWSIAGTVQISDRLDSKHFWTFWQIAWYLFSNSCRELQNILNWTDFTTRLKDNDRVCQKGQSAKQSCLGSFFGNK